MAPSALLEVALEFGFRAAAGGAEGGGAGWVVPCWAVSRCQPRRRKLVATELDSNPFCKWTCADALRFELARKTS